MVVVIVLAEIVDEPIVGIAEIRGAAGGDRVDLLRRQAGLLAEAGRDGLLLEEGAALAVGVAGAGAVAAGPALEQAAEGERRDLAGAQLADEPDCRRLLGGAAQRLIKGASSAPPAAVEGPKERRFRGRSERLYTTAPLRAP